jgi:O-antigen/teichoic acid export membrane protein
LGLYSIFSITTLEYLLLAVIAHNHLTYATGAANESSEPILPAFITYCVPLVPYGWVSFAYLFADRWLLQTYGGGSEQAYYAVGAQLSSIALIATTSIISIFWKEIAEANHRKDFARAGMLYRKISRLLFLVGAAVAGLFVPWTKELLRLIMGKAYAAGSMTFAIMLFYPMHQSIGQISGTMLLATERVRLQVGLGIAFMLVSIVVTYFVLAPATAMVPGLGMASVGLALKMVLIQIIGVNLTAYVVSRIWKFPYDWIYQPVSALGCVGLGIASRYVVMAAIGSHLAIQISMGLAAAFYLLLVAGCVYALPWLIGMTRIEMTEDIYRIWGGVLRYFDRGQVQQ